MLWDVFCRVVDNYGDIGVCWRAAADLASRGEHVRLWVDDPRALTWMAPLGHPAVEVLQWSDGPTQQSAGDVVIEAFGCDPPADFVARMAASDRPPVWINLEYLSAEPYAERSHGLPSPQLSGPGSGLTKWFYYPGFTARSGGLLREPGLMRRQAAFDAGAWLASRGVQARAGERRVSVFCYEQPLLPELLDQLAAQPTLLIATAGEASAQVSRVLGPSMARGGLRAISLPYLPQPEFDALLCACDLNFVRGEDSFVRAQWAAKPFIWQIYPQHDGAHAAKLDAFLDRFGANAEVRAFSFAWNGVNGPLPALPDLAPWQLRCEAWREDLLAQPDLSALLIRFITEKR